MAQSEPVTCYPWTSSGTGNGQSTMKRQLADPSSPSSSSATPSKRAKYEEVPDPEDGGPGASADEGQDAARSRKTTRYHVKRSSEPTDDTSDQGDDDEGYTKTIGIFAHLAAAQRACRREYRALGLDRRHVNGNPNSKWTFEGAADLLDPDYAQAVSLESCWIVPVDFECSDGEDGETGVEEESCSDVTVHVDYSDGEDVETDVEEAQAIDDASLYD